MHTLRTRRFAGRAGPKSRCDLYGFSARCSLPQNDFECQPESVRSDVAQARDGVYEAQDGTTGQGFDLNSEQRRAVELRAMLIARLYLEGDVWTVADTSAHAPYDFYCRKGAAQLFVEVKGTTSSGSSIVLTRNEVAHHQLVYPNNALILVSDIKLDQTGRASMGIPKAICPWSIQESSLTVIPYPYDAFGSEP